MARPQQSSGVRIAAWCGPRSISTALMRSWGNRSDTFVCDEPFYAHYLLHTGIEHPGRDEVLKSQETDCCQVVASLLGPIPGDKTIFYQKHVAHHLLPHMDRGLIVNINGHLVHRDEARISPFDSVVQGGDAVWEGLRF